MLRFNAVRVMNLRGIARPWVFLMKNGFIRATANNFYNGNVKEIKVEHIEKLCRLLNCTPSDLFEWEADADSPALSETHALKALARKKSPPPIAEIVKDLPLEQMEEVGELIRQLKEKE